MVFDEPKILDMRMPREPDLADDADTLGLGLDAGKLDPGAGRIQLNAVEALVEIELPPRAAELTIGRELETDVFLLLMTAMISRSSIARSAASVSSPVTRLARASFSARGRSKLPTWSARNGGVVRWVMAIPPPLSCPRRRASSSHCCNYCGTIMHHRDAGVYWVPAFAGTTAEFAASPTPR